MKFRNLMLAIFGSICLMLAAGCGVEGNVDGEQTLENVQQEQKLDCSVTLCATVYCKAGQSAFVPKGQCCPKCNGVGTPGGHCAGVLCLLSVCNDGETLVYKNANDCCGSCQAATL